MLFGSLLPCKTDSLAVKKPESNCVKHWVQCSKYAVKNNLFCFCSGSNMQIHGATYIWCKLCMTRVLNNRRRIDQVWTSIRFKAIFISRSWAVYQSIDHAFTHIHLCLEISNYVCVYSTKCILLLLSPTRTTRHQIIPRMIENFSRSE